MGIGDPLSEEYEEYKRRSRTSTPFIYEEDGTLTLYFEMGSVQSQMHVNLPDFLMLGYTRTMMGFLLFNQRPRHIGTIGLGWRLDTETLLPLSSSREDLRCRNQPGGNCPPRPLLYSER